jgi:iron(III) transport system substrate-binding protein
VISRVTGAAFLLAAAVVLRTAGAAEPAGPLVLYTSQPDKIAAETVDAFTKRYPKVKVETFRSGTTEVMNKLQAELAGGAPRPDVLFIADAVTMEQLKTDKRLTALPDVDVAALPPEAYDPDRTYFGSKLITTGIMVNAAAAKRPSSWKDLLAPDAKGQVIVPSPLYSGAALIHMAALSDEHVFGPGYFVDLARNGATAARGNGAVLSAVAGGQRLYGVAVDFMALNAKQKGSPVDFVFPEEGVTAVTEPVAVLRTAKNPDAAHAFIDFVLSKDGQELAARQGFLPARKDVAPPAGFPPADKLKILSIDAGKVAAREEELKKTFADLFGG